MPRAKAVSGDVKPKKATVSRAPRRASATTPAKRKAPTVIPASKRQYASKSLVITLGVFVVIMVGSAFLGMADNGQINVTGVIQERGQTLRDQGRDEEASKLVIPKDEVTRRPNGGLQPSSASNNNPPPPPTPEPATLGAEDSNLNDEQVDVAEAESTDSSADEDTGETTIPAETTEGATNDSEAVE